MSYYTPIVLDDLDSIRQQIISLVSRKTAIEGIKFFMIPKQEIFAVEPLYRQLKDLGYLDYIVQVAVNIWPPWQMAAPIHVDTGNFTHSLNIPIVGYANTHLSHFESAVDPELKTFGTVTYREYDRNNCTLVNRVETNSPAIVNTQIPHCYDNFNLEPRLVILLRLSKDCPESLWANTITQ
jgi:hypothetical protein